MIKTVNGRTKIEGTGWNIVEDFVGTAETLLKITPLTAEALHAAVDIAKLIVKLRGSYDELNKEDYKPETEDEPAEEKIAVRKDGVKVEKFEADDLDEMMELLKNAIEKEMERVDD